MKNVTFEATNKRHVDRINSIKSCPGVKILIKIWECEYDEQVMLDSEFAKIIRNENDILPRLEPRNALSGGCTNAKVLHHVRTMGYRDITSLYPYKQNNGHPTIITENFHV